MSVSEEFLQSIREVVGPKGWLANDQDMTPYLEEQRGKYQGSCAIVVRPETTEETAQVVRLCAQTKVPITPQGGNTGLVGGAVAQGGVLLSTDRMTRIREVDPINHTITVEAGCILANIQAAAAETGALFPLSLGAEGSCRIGGNLATNAGGVAVLRYGNARDLTLGLEVVLPDGRIWNGLRALRKDNSGYDLKHLFIGSEGTLGVITAAVLKMFPQPGSRETAFVALSSIESALELFIRVRGQGGESLTAFEVMSRASVELTFQHMPECLDPMGDRHPWYALIELGGTHMESILAKALEDEIINDAVLASSAAQATKLWNIREAIPEAQRQEGASIKHDISTPLSKIPEFIRSASKMVEEKIPDVRIVAFGHMGDGNIHFNLSQPKEAQAEEFLSYRESMNSLVHGLVMEMGGSFSAEHGVGLLKVQDMNHFKSDVELDLMGSLKKVIDPDNIMNPGKVIDP